MAKGISMRTVLLIGLTAPLAAASAQDFSTSTSDFSVEGFAPQICAIQNGQVAEGSPVNFLGLNGTTLQIDRLVDPTTLATRGASVEIDFPAICSYPHRITLESQNNGLWRRSAGTGTAQRISPTACPIPRSSNGATSISSSRPIPRRARRAR